MKHFGEMTPGIVDLARKYGFAMLADALAAPDSVRFTAEVAPSRRRALRPYFNEPLALVAFMARRGIDPTFA